MVYIADQFDDSAGYERFMGHWSRAAGAAFLAWLTPPRDGCWLDVGVGTGALTELALEMHAPKAVFGIDSAQEQIAYVRRKHFGGQVDFRVADARALPFPDHTFDVVVSGLVLNFIPDPMRAVCEMRRVSRPQAIVAGYVWDFEAELSPSWPLRRAMRQLGLTVPPVPGTSASALNSLVNLFEQAGFQGIVHKRIEVALSFSSFDDFWEAQTPRYLPTTKIVEALTNRKRRQLMEAARDLLASCQQRRFAYSAHANAIKAFVG
jgi:ubiquinone/menaquinone biosynthesis C-methylase UbiE